MSQILTVITIAIDNILQLILYHVYVTYYSKIVYILQRIINSISSNASSYYKFSLLADKSTLFAKTNSSSFMLVAPCAGKDSANCTWTKMKCSVVYILLADIGILD